MKKIIITALYFMGIAFATDTHTVKSKDDLISYGKILEVIEVTGYNYLKVDQNGTQRWVAVSSMPLKVGDKIGYDTTTVMKKFQSQQLHRTFDEIVFANKVYVANNTSVIPTLKSAVGQKEPNHPGAQLRSNFVAKPFYTVQELHYYRKNLEGKTITLKAKVYKVSHNIMKKDWVHLGDGSGVESELTDDIVFTADKVDLQKGDSVIAKAKIVIDKDFGFGYFYPILGEDATFDKKTN